MFRFWRTPFLAPAGSVKVNHGPTNTRNNILTVFVSQICDCIFDTGKSVKKKFHRSRLQKII